MLRSVIASVKQLSSVAVLATSSVFFLVSSVEAASTRIDTVVCSGTSSNASLTIATPASDTVITTLPLTVSGTLQSITQIDITVDGFYDSTVPVAANQETFSFPLQLSPGTHTIELNGNDICQFQNPTKSIVITYAPPAGGGDEEEEDGGGTTNPPRQEGGAVTGEPIDNSSNPPFTSAIGKGITSVIVNIAEALDIDATIQQDGLGVAMARFGAFTTGVGLFFFGGFVSRRLYARAIKEIALAQGRMVMQDPDLQAKTKRNALIAQGAGLLLIIVAFVL